VGDAEQPITRTPRGTGRRLHGAIAHKLGVAILSGKFAPGDTLSGEVAFSEALDVSRSAYREAVQVRTAKGFVESRPKAGTRPYAQPTPITAACSTRSLPAIPGRRLGRDARAGRSGARRYADGDGGIAGYFRRCSGKAWVGFDPHKA
jgi:DNA-binding transcriptional MocR family regulator